VDAGKVTFNVTNNIEVGFTRSVFWGGDGHPVTVGSFLDSLGSLTPGRGCNINVYGARCSKGNSHGGFDFRWRVKGLEKYVSLYSDSFSDSRLSPLGSPTSSAWAPGISFSQLPHLSKLDLRLESYSTLLYTSDAGGNSIYWNSQYHDSYTNDGYLLGSWVGRDARAYVAAADYWASGRTRIQAQVRDTQGGGRFLPGGGKQQDGSLMIQYGVTSELLVNFTGQYERYDIPVLGPRRNNKTASFTITYTPKNIFIQ
jgi:hypothetical protein